MCTSANFAGVGSEEINSGIGGSHPLRQFVDGIRIAGEYALKCDGLATPGAEVSSFLMPPLMCIGEHS